MMKLIDKIGDWIVAKPYRYWITQYILYVVLFLAACFTVACFFVLLTKAF